MLRCVGDLKIAGGDDRQLLTIQVRLASVWLSPLLFSICNVIEDREAIKQQRNKLDKASQQLTHQNLKKWKENTKFNQHYDSERRIGSKMAKELQH